MENNKTRIIILGNNNMAVDCLDYLLEKGEEIAMVVADPQKPDATRWQKSLKEFALGKNLPFSEPANINSPESVAVLKSLESDFIFSFQYRQILKKEVIEIPKKACINLHFAYLPQYRGCHPNVWAIINGEEFGGVTLHYIFPGVDNGDIIAQEKVPITAGDNARNLYDKCTAAGVRLFRETFPLIKEGKNKNTPQNEKNASFYLRSSIDFKKNRIDWSKNYTELYKWIRAFIFPPLQLPETSFNGSKFGIFRAKLSSHAEGTKPGEIMGIDENGMIVSASGGCLLVQELETEKTGEISPADFCAEHGIKKGDVLEN